MIRSVSGCPQASCQHSFVTFNGVNIAFAPALLPDRRAHDGDCGGLPALLAVKRSSATLFERPACRRRNQAGPLDLLLQRVTFCLPTSGVWTHQMLGFSRPLLSSYIYCPLKHSAELCVINWQILSLASFLFSFARFTGAWMCFPPQISRMGTILSHI